MQRSISPTPPGENPGSIDGPEVPRRIPEVSIYDESDRLTAAALWGPVGIEAYLATLYPREISLFYDDVDVFQANKESLDYNDLLQSEGVETFLIRDYLADLAPRVVMAKEDLLYRLGMEAYRLMQTYGKGQNKDMESVFTDIARLVEADITRYGEQRAINLNHLLGLHYKFPPGNLLYARDQMNVVLGKRIKSRMSKKIRQPEVELYEQVYKQILPNHEVIEIPEGETFEGGDLYIHNGIVYIGIGSRTTPGAAKAIFANLKDTLDQHGYQFAMVMSTEFAGLSFAQQQDTMHLDTFSNPAGRNDIIVDEEEGAKRQVIFLLDVDGEVVPYDTGLNFIQFLKAKGENVHLIPKEEQRTFGCNFQSLNNDTVIVPTDTNLTALAELAAAGKRIINAGLKQCTNGWGAAHCMTGQLARKPV